VRIDEDRANPIVQPERSVDAQVSGSQVLYSDDAYAALEIAAYLEASARLGLQTVVLDTLRAAANAYLTALRALALEGVRRSNLDVTRRNLELARLRETIGFSGRGDVLRWESQLATDRQNLIGAESDRRVAVTDFNRVLNWPQDRPFEPAGEDVARSIALFEDERFRAFIDNAAVWETFQDFSVERTLAQAPELKQLEETIRAQERQVRASRRKYFVPEVTLAGMHGTNISRGGTGSDVSGFGLDDHSWSVAVTASWPLFTSGALDARLSRERWTLIQLERQRAFVEEQLEARTRAALHRASGTYPAVELSADAQGAANENLELVTDAYGRGAVSVTDLIDAQNAALAAELRAADARYAYLIDVVDVLRSTGDFSLLLDREGTEAWFREVETWFLEHRAPPRR
jgi:outer membrane protein TolC